MNSDFKEIYALLESLSRDELYDILTHAGISYPSTKRENLTKEELLLVADEADINILRKLLTDKHSQ